MKNQSHYGLRYLLGILAPLTLLLFIAFLNGCKKEDGSAPNKVPIVVLEPKVLTTLFIRVLDGEGKIIENAEVKVGNMIGITNELGILMLTDVEVPK